MIIHKYLFVISEEKGIKTFKITNNTNFEVIRCMGEEYYNSGDIKEFFEWFDENTSIIKGEDHIDYCFLSKNVIDSPIFEDAHYKKEKSTWTKYEISQLLKKEMCVECDDICLDTTNNSFRLQVGEGTCAYNYYMRCIPEFVLEKKEKKEKKIKEQQPHHNNTEPGILYKYFKKKLAEI